MKHRLIINATALLDRSGRGNAHQLALNSHASASTIARYFSKPEDVKAMDFSILYRILRFGLSLTDRQIEAMRLGDVFQIVEDNS
jgi:hypothetical protein